MPSEYKTPQFSLYPTSQDTTKRVDFSMQAVNTEIQLVMCPIPLFVPLCDHNPPTLEMNGCHTSSKSTRARHHHHHHHHQYF